MSYTLKKYKMAYIYIWAEWLICYTKKLALHTNKTKYILYQYNRSIKVVQTVTVSANIKERVKTTLVVVLDNRLELESHTLHCKKGISSGLYALNMTK